MSNFQLYYNTTCCPDYFQGHSGLVLAVPVHHGMTYTGLFDDLKRELNACDYGPESYGLTHEMLHDMVDTWIKGAQDDLKRQGFDACTMIFYKNSEHDDDSDDDIDQGDSIYAYFIVMDADTVDRSFQF